MTPKMVVEMLDRYIVGQSEAKRAVSIALRNRWRRHRIASPLKEEIVPKNILMIGPTGCGKTEIARRLAKLVDAPFIKVEATKFTEVGFHGRDVDQIIRDLVEASLSLTKQKLKLRFAKEIGEAVENTILDLLTGEQSEASTRSSFRELLREGALDDRSIDYQPPDRQKSFDLPVTNFADLVVKVDHRFGAKNRSDKRSMKISEARPLIEEAEQEKLLSTELVSREAIASVESDGIVFIDEIDKIVASNKSSHSADASNEGVQRDLLPIIEGSSVSTKHGNVNTDHILFVCSGAFHAVKPSDMLAELQGRLPIRVNLKGLTREDMYRILTEPENNLIKQQQALLATEGMDIHFTEEALHEVAKVAAEVNRTVENIGARRLYTVLERIVDDISFGAPDVVAEHKLKNPGDELYRVVIDAEDVRTKLNDLMQTVDLSKYVL
eukprot:CAMPEP_0196595316 /NCGR_PEP_ID=MMETSP1081-20130531/80775_1 /TAXON_ID=36882 /ORGANISM="Pyramimonas amylifera, Strain CCMP720" /LENGTH=438 /DNA_ID=CAMNT_0041919845 /DNA_START=300 /DNA_END=1616 /DNA_ORIENTATION=-